MYVCPFCSSGTGKNHTGAFSINSKDSTHWKCFSCGKSGDIFDLIGEIENISKPVDQLKRAYELYGTNISQIHKTHSKIKSTIEKKENLISYYKICQSHLNETDYHNKRGISNETSSRFIIGFDGNYNKNTGGKIWKSLIIPTGPYSYVVRNTNPNAEEKDRYRKVGNVIQFNVGSLKTSTKPIFIVEGEIDALSIIEVGGESIGLGSTSNINLFVNNYLKKCELSHPLVLSLDNDDKGKEATVRLEKELEKLNVPFYRIDPYNGLKDANSALLNNRESFTQEIRKIENLSLKAECEEYLKTSSYNYLQDFVDKISENVNTNPQITGFNKLDKILDGGLYEGLYVIGAMTSLGKTTLSLQIADQIAESGRDVLIFFLEMSRFELMSKSISKLTLLNVLKEGIDVKNAKTGRGITVSNRYSYYSQKELEIIKKSIESYANYSKHVYIHEGIGNIGGDYVREVIKKHISFTRQIPVVLIDYIQILSPYDIRATDKQNIDKSVLELKRISRDCKLPIIGISSVNRASYNNQASMEMLKESGSLEYGNDVIWGLQFKGVKNKEFDINLAKSKDPREIELIILKNINGISGEIIDFEYYLRFNYFREV